MDSGDGDDALLIARHERGAGATVAAGELLRAGCEGRPERLRDFMAGRIRDEAAGKSAAMKDIEALAPAVDQFLFEVCNAGKIAMPPEVAHRYRELKRWIDEALADPCSQYPVDDHGVSMLFTWSVELKEIRRRYPPPRLSREIRDLMQTRALRRLRGEDVKPEQDALERARIAVAREWPGCERINPPDKERSMQRTTVEPKTVVYEIVCDRCGKEVQREGNDFELMTSIGFEAGYASIFGDGNRVEIDLCEPCVRDTLGTWLRVRTPEDTPLARMRDKFKPEVHGGEFPARELHGPRELADSTSTVADAQMTARTTELPNSWVPISELFNRLADGATLEQILEEFPQISRHGASHALREAALRFPPHACFHSAVEVWTPRNPHEL